MSHEMLPILADGTDDMIKLIFGAVFVLIWIVGGLMSASKKKPRTQTPQKSWDEIFRELSGEAARPQQQQQQPPPPPRPAQVQQRPRPPVTVTTTVKSAPPSGPAVRKKLRRKQRIEVQPPAVPPPPPQPVPQEAPFGDVAIEPIPAVPHDIAKTEIGTGKAKRTIRAGETLKEIHAALHPDNLRYQFILTEILQPPKALREDA